MVYFNWKAIYGIILLLSIITYIYGIYLIYDLYCKVDQAKKLLEIVSTINFYYNIVNLTTRLHGDKLNIYAEILFNIQLTKTASIKGPVFKLLFKNNEISRFDIDYLNKTNITRIINVNFNINGIDIDKPIYIVVDLNLSIGSAEYRNVLVNISSVLSKLMNMKYEYRYVGNYVELKMRIDSVFQIELPINILLLNKDMNTIFSKNISSFNTYTNNEFSLIIDFDDFTQTNYLCIETYSTKLICSKIK